METFYLEVEVVEPEYDLVKKVVNSMQDEGIKVCK